MEIQHLFLSHFQELFNGSSCRGSLDFGHIFEEATSPEVAQQLAALDVRLSGDQIKTLEDPFTESEVRDAVFQMKGMNAPGPDGFVAGFYQQNWSWIGSDVVNMVLAFLHSEVMLRELNRYSHSQSS